MDTTASRVRSTQPLGYVFVVMGPVPLQLMRTFHASEISPCGDRLEDCSRSVRMNLAVFMPSCVNSPYTPGTTRASGLSVPPNHG